jgi:hypothetical protein
MVGNLQRWAYQFLTSQQAIFLLEFVGNQHLPLEKRPENQRQFQSAAHWGSSKLSPEDPIVVIAH